MRLKTKFNFMVMAGMAIPILLLGTIAYHISRDILKNRISNELITSVENSINKIDRLLFERSISIEQWAGNSTFRTALDYRWGVNKARDVMLDLKANSGGAVREIALVDKNGICFVSTDVCHTEDQIDWGDTKWWLRSINGDTYFHDWDLLDVEKNVAGVVFSTPIIKHIQDLNSIKNYEYLGVLVLFIDWSTIENELKNIKRIFKEAGVNAFAFLLHNEKEGVIAHSDHRQYASSITGMFPPEKIQLMKDGYAGLYTLDYQGEQHTICFIRDQGFQSYPGFNWTLVIGVRDSDLFRSLRYLFFTFFLIGIAAAIIALLVDLLFTHSVLTPLSFLAGKMNLVKKGDYT
ncbi:MAG: cache domain-containing protein, partial [Thermodesulfobacteriota bacterium]|nr:cache domain-containing protein [Thermodesulfobacteriota bacterium]